MALDKKMAPTKSRYIPPLKAPSYYELVQARRTRQTHGLEVNTLATPSSQVFYWDSAKLQFTNAINVAPDTTLKAASYVLQATVYNFHAASADMQNLFSADANNVQVGFRAKATQDGEDFTWIIMAGLNIASQFMGGSDNQSVSLANTDNQITNFQSPNDQLVITSNDSFALWISLDVQQKDSWWDTFLKAIKIITNSPLFALVPMAKLASEATAAVDQMTQQIEQQNKLITIITGNRLDFRIQEGPSAPFVLRPGFWIVMNYDQAQQYVGPNDPLENLRSGIELDLGSQQYDVVDRKASSAPIDATYAIINIELKPKSN